MPSFSPHEPSPRASTNRDTGLHNEATQAARFYDVTIIGVSDQIAGTEIYDATAGRGIGRPIELTVRISPNVPLDDGHVELSLNGRLYKLNFDAGKDSSEENAQMDSLRISYIHDYRKFEEITRKEIDEGHIPVSPDNFAESIHGQTLKLLLNNHRPGLGGSPEEVNQQLNSQQSQLRIAPLIEGLKDPDGDGRYKAALALGRIGPEARDAVPALAAALKDSGRDVRFGAAWALGAIGPDARDAVLPLAAALKDSDWGVRGQVALALGQIGPNARIAASALASALNDPEWLVRRHVASALREIGPDAVPALTVLLKDPDEEVRDRAATALKEIELDNVVEKEIATHAEDQIAAEKHGDTKPPPLPTTPTSRRYDALVAGNLAIAAFAIGSSSPPVLLGAAGVITAITVAVFLLDKDK